MVKNLPTVERSTKIRFGRNCTNDQAENTVVFNASNVEIDAAFENSIYMTPLRLRTDLSDRNITVLAYNRVTKEIMDSDAIAEDILNFTLEAAVKNGNVTAIQFHLIIPRQVLQPFQMWVLQTLHRWILFPWVQKFS